MTTTQTAAAAGETRKDWETVQEDVEQSVTQRLRIPGGWLYRTLIEDGGAVAMVFVPGLANES